MPTGTPLPESLKRVPAAYQPKNPVEAVATDIAHEVCRTVPMMQRLGAADYEIQTKLRLYIQKQLLEFAAVTAKARHD